ncbi:MAG: tripartite tricarboxylate transporter TctB family protein [Neisseriaceae bacterium]|nr:tripartite tricarboxylate transporter TctB family protein [Neisseriaceae bacterium]
MSLSVISSFLLMVLGIVYALATYMMPTAALGRANEPKIFPAILAFFLIASSAALFFKELKAYLVAKKESTQDDGTISKQYAIQILLTIANGVLYTLMFNRIGYSFSTIIFLMLQFVIFGGVKNLKYGWIVAVVFTLSIYFIFNNLLGIILPRSALGFM